MAKIIEMPKLSPTMEEGVLVVWHKKEGDTVHVDDLLADVETDKATMEFRSFDATTLLKLLVPAGAQVRLGQPVAISGTPGEPIDLLLQQVSHSPPSPAPMEPHPSTQKAPPSSPLERRDDTPVAFSLHSGNPLDRTEREASVDAPVSGRVLASPYVRKTARERGVNLEAAQGSGPGGRIRLEDLPLQPSMGQTATSAQEAPLPPERKPLSPMRKTIAKRLTESKQTVPHFYLHVDVDAGALLALRTQLNQDLAACVDPTEEAKAVKVSLNDLLLKAAAYALKRVPACNAQYTPEALLFPRQIDISLAVAIDEGLVTPVVRNADQKSVLTIAQEVRALVARARARKLRPEEMQNGTFSLSNLGMYGIDSFAAVINPPEGAILAVGQVRSEPVVRGEAVVPGHKLGLTLSCDHRVVDGSVGASFLAALRMLIEHPAALLV